MDRLFIRTQLLRKQNLIWDEFDSANQPELLLHYTSPDSFHSIIESREIWCTDIRDLNDPREGDYGLEVIQSVVARNKDRVSQRFAEEVAQYRSLFGLNEFWSQYVACFCSGGEQAYMWQNYACEQTGCAIGFSYERLIAGATGGKKYALFRVLYDRGAQEQAIEATLEHAFAIELTMNLCPNDHRKFWLNEVAIALISCVSRFKNPKWRCEQEFRLMVTDPPDILKFESGGKSRIRVAFAPDAVRQVIRGARSGSDLDAQAIRNILTNHAYAVDVQVANAQK